MTPIRCLLISLLVALQMTACTPIVETRGNMLSETKVAAITPGVSGRADVESYWGPPTTVAPFDQNIWYYIGETNSQRGIFEHEVDRRQMIRVNFGENDIVDQVTALDPRNGREIAFIDRKTPTAGKEFTAFQQFIGNLGKYNTKETK